jgi:uncharacterized Zn-finger protein
MQQDLPRFQWPNPALGEFLWCFPIDIIQILTYEQLHLTNEHVERPVVDPARHWRNCAYSNKVRKNLVSHVNNHVPEYLPIVCGDCNKGFKQQSHLTRHQKEACPN